jgi:hypothetical protein
MMLFRITPWALAGCDHYCFIDQFTGKNTKISAFHSESLRKLLITATT